MVVRTFGCPQPTAFASDGAHPLDPSLQPWLTVIAGVESGTGPTPPNLFGLSAHDAERRAQAAGFSLAYDGQIPDDDVPLGTVVLQAPPAGVPLFIGGPDQQIAVYQAVPSHARRCRSSDLAADFRNGGLGAGNALGLIEVRNTSATPCVIDGQITVQGLNGGRRPVTDTVQAASPVAVLTPNAPVVPPGGSPSIDEIVLDLQLSAEYRDDPASAGGLCTTHQVVPAQWRADIVDGSLLVPNGDAHADALPTCRGHLGLLKITVL